MEGILQLGTCVKHKYRQSPTRATSPSGEELQPEQEDEETIEDASPESDSTSLRRSSRARRPPACYDPSNEGGESVTSKIVTNTDSHIYHE